MRLENMTNEAINREVASYFYDAQWLSRHAEKLGMIPDYCNDPSEAWPIIVENDITVRGGGVAYYDGNEAPAFITRYKNPLRAAMICFLKMKEK